MTNLHRAAFDSDECRAKQREIETGLGERQEQAVGAIGERANTEAVLKAGKARGALPREAALKFAERRVRQAMRCRRFAIL